MKKIVLGVATVLLSLGLLAGCNNDDVDDKINNTGPEENEPTDEGNEGPGPETGGSGSGYYFGFESDDVLYYITGDTIARGDYCGEVTTDINEAVEVTFEVDTEVENAYYISFKYEEVEHWITIITGNYTNLSYATEKAPIYLHTDGEAEYFGNESGDYFLCYNSTYKCLYTSKVSEYITSSPVAGIYTASGELVAGGVGKTPEPLPEIDPNDLSEVKTGKLGLYQGGKGNYYYFAGTINDSGFGVLSTSWDAGVSVTELTTEEYVVLRIGEADSYKYIGAEDVNASRVALYDEPYALTYDETYDAFLTAYGERFIGTYGTYETLSWSDASKYLGEDGQYAAQLYTEEQKLPAPTSANITISGPTSVYVDSTITLTATVDAGYDQSIVWSTESEYATVDANTGVVTGVAEGTATIKATSGADTNAYKEYTISVVALPVGVSLLGTFDFTSIASSDTTAFSDPSTLDSYWTGESSLYLGIRETSNVFIGGGGSYYPSNETTCIKFGTGSAGGSIQLKFALGTSITQVVLTASGWAGSGSVSAADLTVNGQTQACSTTGTLGELTYNITEDWTYLLTMEASARCTVHSISIYGTYDPNNVPYAGAITIAPETTSTLNVGESDAFTVSWEAGKVFDIDTLTWTSSAPTIVSVEGTTKGATAHALAAGEASITASDGTITSNSVTLRVEDVLQESETILATDHSDLSSSNPTIDGHQVTLTFAKGSNSTFPAYNSEGSIRFYKGNTLTFTPKYEAATITSVVITCKSSSYLGGDAMTLTNGGGDTVGSISQSGSTVTLTPTTTGEFILTNNDSSSNTQLRITSITVHYTIAQ